MGRKLNPIYSIVLVLFVFIIIIPIAYTLVAVLFSDNALIENLKLFNADLVLLLFKSIMIAALVAGISTLIGTLLGFLLYKTNVKFRIFFKLVFLIPLLISPYILAVAWKDLFYYFFKNSVFISSYFSVIFVLITIFTPLAMLIVGNSLSGINKQLEESGFIITNFKRVIIKIILPLIKPAIFSSFTLIFIFSISEFSVPAFLGVKVFTTEIFTQFSAFYNHSLAILQSSILIVICIFLLLSEKNYLLDAPFFSVGSKGTFSKLYDIKSKKRLVYIVLFAWLFISIIIPFFTLVLQSFKDGFDSFIRAFKLLLPTFSTSISLAVIGSVFIVFIGFVAAYFTSKGNKLFDWILLLVFAIPSTIFGISLIKFYNNPNLTFIYSSYAIILIGYIGKYSFISSKIIGNAIIQIPKSLDEVAQMEGVSIGKRLLKILIPLIAPSIFLSFIVSFILSIGELGTTIMVYPPGTEIMPVKVFTIMANAPQSLTSSMTLIVLSLTLLLIWIFYLTSKYIFRIK